MDDDLHIILPGVLHQDIEEIIKYEKLLEPVMGITASSFFNDVVLEAILYFKLYCQEACECYGVLPVKEDK